MTTLCQGNIAATRSLLDGVISRAQRTVARAVCTPPPTPARRVWRLAGYYHTRRATPPLMREAAERFSAAGRTRLAAYVARKAEEESRHDELALRDLKAIGYQAELLVERLIPPTSSLMKR